VAQLPCELLQNPQCDPSRNSELVLGSSQKIQGIRLRASGQRYRADRGCIICLFLNTRRRRADRGRRSTIRLPGDELPEPVRHWVCRGLLFESGNPRSNQAWPCTFNFVYKWKAETRLSTEKVGCWRRATAT
jgi:hypothetical protein